MRVAKWGNSLAVRLPAGVFAELRLKEGDQVEIRAARRHMLELSRDRKLQEILKEMERISRPLPPGYKFNRADAYER